jgi:hypothetical protein
MIRRDFLTLLGGAAAREAQADDMLEIEAKIEEQLGLRPAAPQ